MQGTSTLRSSEDHSSSTLFTLNCLLVFVLSIGFLDLLLGLLSSRQQFPTFSLASISVLITIVSSFALYLFFWILLRLVGRRFAMQRSAAEVSLAVLIGTIFIFGSLSNFQLERSANDMLQASLALLFCIACSILTYIAAVESMKRTRFRKVAGALLFSLPFLLAITAGALQWTRALPNRKMGLLIFGITEVILLCFTFWIFYSVGSEKRGAKSLAILLFLALISPLSGLTSSSGASEQLRTSFKPSQHAVKHVILITIDTLRADALRLYSEKGITAPSIEKLARNGTLFKKTISEGPWTLPSLTTILTGLSPLVHGVVDVKRRLPPSIPTLAEYMNKAGYTTAAIGSNSLLENQTLSRGFLKYSFVPIDSSYLPAKKNFGLTMLRRLESEKKGYSSTRRITDLSSEWIRNNNDKDFFLWIHYFDPHHPYAPPEKYATSGKISPAIGMNASQELIDSIKTGHYVPTAAEREWIKQLYLSEVRYVDDALGVILQTLEKAGLYENSLIILTSDHGEEFWEHGTIGHSHTVYHELLHVPLIIKFPGVTGSSENNDNVSTAQIMPTILDICGIPFKRESLSSRSLLGSSDATEQAIVSTGVSIRQRTISVTSGDMKYVRDLISNREELYDLSSDPQEQISLVKVEPDRLRTASRLLEMFERDSLRLREFYKITGTDKSTMDEETEEQLRGLGYIQ